MLIFRNDAYGVGSAHNIHTAQSVSVPYVPGPEEFSKDWSQKLAFSAAIVCMKVDYGFRMHGIEALFQIQVGPTSPKQSR